MPDQKLRILCLGASLVAGYSASGAVYRPFAHRLAQMLQDLLPGVEVETVVDGVPGDFVSTGTFSKRMQKHFVNRSESKPFDWTIVLGATNDIATLIDVEEIIDMFQQIWAIPLSHGSKVLALTVPGATLDQNSPRLVARRNRLNERIIAHEAENFHVLDLYSALPYDLDHAKYWDDAIHFTPAGYDFIGGIIAAQLSKLILEAASNDP